MLAFVWAFVIWKWSDPVTALYTRYEQHQLKSQYVHVREKVVSRCLSSRRRCRSREKHQLTLIANHYRADAKTGTRWGGSRCRACT